MNNLSKKTGFTLIELTIVLIIIAMLFALVISSSKSRIDASKIYITKSRLETIENAIDKYVELYGRLPCPSQITLSNDDTNYGVSSINANNTCSNVKPVGGASGYMKGGVPYRILGLSPTDVVDGWGLRFDYIMTQAYTDSVIYNSARTGTVTDEKGINYNIFTRGTAGARVAGGDDISYLLISHGPNGYGGYNDDGAHMTSAAHGTDEEKNSNEASPSIFIQSPPRLNFDDILVIKKTSDLPIALNNK